MTPEVFDAMITVGRIVRPHGHKGAVVVESESDFAPERFREGSALWWQRSGEPSVVTVASSREFRGRWVVTLDGVASMNEAETLRGLELRVPTDALHALGDDTHYVHDLEGCAVVTMGGDHVGRVSRVQFGSGAPLLVVASQGGEVLIPLAAHICRRIDVKGKRIDIDPPEGLLELNRARARAE
ncbi:MAG TPA: ribosome maturation factor RimM [Vicinamibacterales bacterium]|nr:ribosome maturation factor RimM [Vicinamibacterales bacterium]